MEPKIEIWTPRTNGSLRPIEVMRIENGQGVTYRTRPVGNLDWHINMSEQVLTAYYEPTGELTEVA